METGTLAAAAGGITTVVDMPLNNFPCTTTGELLQAKLKAAKVPRLVYAVVAAVVVAVEGEEQ